MTPYVAAKNVLDKWLQKRKAEKLFRIFQTSREGGIVFERLEPGPGSVVHKVVTSQKLA